MVTAANAGMHLGQQKLDDDTDYGAEVGIPFGGITLDPDAT
jgi:hypothetical protein